MCEAIKAVLDKHTLTSGWTEQNRVMLAGRIAAGIADAGLAIVPVEPTMAMMDAGLHQSSADSQWADVHSAWKDMVATAQD